VVEEGGLALGKNPSLPKKGGEKRNVSPLSPLSPLVNPKRGKDHPDEPKRKPLKDISRRAGPVQAKSHLTPKKAPHRPFPLAAKKRPSTPTREKGDRQSKGEKLPSLLKPIVRAGLIFRQNCSNIPVPIEESNRQSKKAGNSPPSWEKKPYLGKGERYSFAAGKP